MERGGCLSSETCVALDERRVLGRVHLGVLHPGQQLVRGDSIQVPFHLMKLKQFFYAIICALFSDIFIVRYRVELILFVPSATGFFGDYLKWDFNKIAQRNLRKSHSGSGGCGLSPI